MPKKTPTTPAKQLRKTFLDAETAYRTVLDSEALTFEGMHYRELFLTHVPRLLSVVRRLTGDQLETVDEWAKRAGGVSPTGPGSPAIGK